MRDVETLQNTTAAPESMTIVTLQILLPNGIAQQHAGPADAVDSDTDAVTAVVNMPNGDIGKRRASCPR